MSFHMVSVEALKVQLRRVFNSAEIELIMKCADNCGPIEVKISRLEFARIMKGWSLTELSKRSGVSAMCIYQIETGRTKCPREETMMALADALGVPISTIY